MKMSRPAQGIVLALVILTIISLALLLAQLGVRDAARHCALTVWWIGCAMAEHENLAGGLIGAGGALFAGWLAWSAVRDQIDLERTSVEPDVVAYIIPDKRHLNILQLVVANVGGGVAHDVSLRLTPIPRSLQQIEFRYLRKRGGRSFRCCLRANRCTNFLEVSWIWIKLRASRIFTYMFASLIKKELAGKCYQSISCRL